VCILLVEDYPMGKKTKPCSLMMSQAKLFEIPRAVGFFVNLLEDISCPKIGAMVGPHFVIVVNVDRITFCKYSSNAFSNHHQIF